MWDLLFAGKDISHRVVDEFGDIRYAFDVIEGVVQSRGEFGEDFRSDALDVLNGHKEEDVQKLVWAAVGLGVLAVGTTGWALYERFKKNRAINKNEELFREIERLQQRQLELEVQNG